MEKLSSIIDAIKERLTNPLFLSFLISWLCWNWQIPIALFWFDTKQLYSTASWNYVDYVRSQLDCWSVIVPILFSLGYTFGMPLFMNKVRQFNAWIVKKGNDLVFKESQESKVSFENYYIVLHGNEEKARKLEEMIENQQSLRKQFDSSQKRAVELESVITTRDTELKTLKDEKKIIADDYKSNIDQKDLKIETMQISLDGFIKESAKLKTSVDLYRKDVSNLEARLNEGDQIILNKNEEIRTLNERHEQKLQQLDFKSSNDRLVLQQENATKIEAIQSRHRIELASIKDQMDNTVLNGRWHIAYQTPDGTETEDVTIEGENFRKNNAIHQILSFRKDRNRLTFVLLRNGEFEVFILNIESPTILRGEVNNRNVVFSR